MCAKYSSGSSRANKPRIILLNEGAQGEKRREKRE